MKIRIRHLDTKIEIDEVKEVTTIHYDLDTIIKVIQSMTIQINKLQQTNLNADEKSND